MTANQPSFHLRSPLAPTKQLRPRAVLCFTELKPSDDLSQWTLRLDLSPVRTGKPISAWAANRLVLHHTAEAKLTVNNLTNNMAKVATGFSTDGSMRISISTVLDAPFAKVCEELGKSRLLVHVAAPLVKFCPITPPSFPSEWRDGRYLVAMRLGGVLPLGRQWIEISHPEPEASDVYRIRDNGSGQLVRTWDHHITIRDRPDGRTDYHDEVEVRAGIITPIIATFAAVFYRHRQRRWRALARSEFKYS